MAAFIAAQLGLNPAAYGLGAAAQAETSPASGGNAVTGTGASRTRTATEKQVSYIKSLIASRDTTGIELPEVIEEISFAKARKLLDQLTAAPRVTPDTATPAQVAFLKELFTAKKNPAMAAKMIADVERIVAGGNLKRDFAHDLINQLLTLPDVAPATVKNLVGPGMYVLDGQIFRVKNSRGGRPYASLLNVKNMTYTYVCGAITQLKPEHRMNAEQAARFGRETGCCCVCARTLLRKDSIDRGIGPVCAGKV